MDVGSLLFYGAVALWSGAVAYFVVLRLFPESHPAAPEPTPVATPAQAAAALPSATMPDFKMTDGFKSFQSGADLTVEDIVKGLSRKR